MRNRSRFWITVLFVFVIFSPVVLAEELIEKVEFKDANVLAVVETLAKQASLDLVVSGDVNLIQNKKTSVQLRNVTALQAIDQILETNGLSYEKKAGTILLSLLPQAQAQPLYQGRAKNYLLKHLKAEEVKDILQRIIPELKTSVGGRANCLLLQGKGKLIKEAQYLISLIDKPVPQILIESQVLEISSSESSRLGLSFGEFQLGEEIQTKIKALLGQGGAQVIARPSIATLDNHEAIINIGSRIPYAVPVSNSSGSIQWTVEYIDAGVKLKITPTLNENALITTAIQPEVSSISEWRTTSAGEFPVITTRNAQSLVRIKDGETIVVGGLISENQRENVTRLPILGQIPLLGFLFQNKTVEQAKTEIVFLITPHII